MEQSASAGTRAAPEARTGVALARRDPRLSLGYPGLGPQQVDNNRSSYLVELFVIPRRALRHR
eukprot:3061419-Pyramimonas_sp.AAC.1